MKAIEFNTIGGPEVLQIVERELPQPKDNEVLVKIKACGLNQAELLFFQGQYLFQPNFPSKVGLEASGIVEKIGADVTGCRVGDEVCLTPNIMPYEHGYIGEYAIAPEEAVVSKPEDLTFEEAASFWMTYGTAYAGLIMRGNLKYGDGKTVLITAATSAVGLASIQMAKYMGANVIATTRNENKVDLLKTQGADFVINTTEQDLVSEVQKITTGKGFEIAFDPIAGNILNNLAEAAAKEACIVIYGALSFEPEAPYPLFPSLAKGLTFTGVHLVFHLLQHRDRFDKMKEHLLEQLASGAYKPVIDRTFSLDQIREAYSYMKSNQQKGKIVISV